MAENLAASSEDTGRQSPLPLGERGPPNPASTLRTIVTVQRQPSRRQSRLPSCTQTAEYNSSSPV